MGISAIFENQLQNMRLTAYLSLFSVFVLSASSQNVVDSLYNVLESTSEDTSRLNLLFDISDTYEFDDADGLKVAMEAYELSLSVDSDAHRAESEATLALFYYGISADSALALSNSAIERYTKLGLFKKISDTYWNMALVLEGANQFDSAISYLQKSLVIAEQKEYLRGIGDAHASLGIIYNIRGKNSLALEHSLKSKINYEKDGDQKLLGQALNQMGIVYDHMGLYPEAIDNYLRAREIAIQTKDIDDEILVLNNLGVIYDNMNNPALALNYYTEALEKLSINERKEDEATLLNNLSYIYLAQEDTSKALEALWKSLALNAEVKIPCFDIYPMEGLGTLYLALGDLDSADFYLQTTLEKAERCEDVTILALTHKSLGQVNSKRGNKRKALGHLNKSLQLSGDAQLIVEKTESTYELFRYYKDLGNNSLALRYLESYQKLADSIHKNQSVEKANQLAAEYAFRKRIDSLKADQVASEIKFEEELEIRRRENNYILLALILAAILVGTMARFYYVLQKRNKKLNWLNEEKNTLMGVVAHDLRSPLNSIQGLLSLINGTSKKRKSDDEKQYLNLIKLSTDKMRGMIDRVLDVSAIENMKVNLNLVKSDLTKLLAATSENFAHVAAQKDIQIQNEFKEETNCFSNIDPNYFDQIVDNLISNAIKFSDEGKKIYLNLKQEDDRILMSIRDEGPGISEEDQQNLFQKFTTLASKPTSQERSTGLGLSIAHKFVTAMDGEIYCSSKKGEGATFFLKFKKA